MTVINASAAATLLEQRPEKNSGSDRARFEPMASAKAGAVLFQLSNQSHMRAVVYGLALYMWTLH